MLRAIRNLFRERHPPPIGETAVDLGDVLANDWLELWYQPKIDLRSKRLAGVEALARARHPRRGILDPVVFLTGASEAHLITLTKYVIERALRDWEDFAAYGMPLTIALNTPMAALTRLSIAEIVRGRPPKAPSWPGLILEVTEAEMIKNVDVINEVAASVGACNCTLSLDDSGAGHSSLARLTRLPFSELKIDRCYIANCHADPVNAGVCEVMVELGRQFGLKTVAEGIETIYEFHWLRRLGCDIGQGFLFSKPMPKNELIGTALRHLVAAGAPVEGYRASA